MIVRIAALTLLLALAGCASTLQTQPDQSQPAAPGSRYQAEPGLDAATVAQMRAAPPPASADVSTGKNRAGDRRRLAASGFVAIGTGYFPGTDTTARDDAIGQGRQLGADKILLYAPPESEAIAGAASEWLADYYVRFQLPFGATFRDLRPQERAALGSSGVAIGAVIGGTPASRANLIAGDFVLKLNGQAIDNRAAFQALLKKNAGRPVTLTMVRNEVTLERVVRLGAIPAATPR